MDPGHAGSSLMGGMQFERVGTFSWVTEDRHQPGKHDQKKHGHGGRAPTAGGNGSLTEEQYDSILPRPGQTKANALKQLDRTPEGKALVSVVDSWQRDECPRIQKDFMARSQGKPLNKQADAKITALMAGMRDSPMSPELYRGVRMPKGFDPKTALKNGTTFVLPPSSFSSSSRTGRAFAKAQGGRQKDGVPVVYRVKAARGLPVEVFGSSRYKSEREWISAGQYKVTGVSKGRDGVYTVDVDHTAMFSW